MRVSGEARDPPGIGRRLAGGSHTLGHNWHNLNKVTVDHDDIRSAGELVISFYYVLLC